MKTTFLKQCEAQKWHRHPACALVRMAWIVSETHRQDACATMKTTFWQWHNLNGARTVSVRSASGGAAAVELSGVAGSTCCEPGRFALRVGRQSSGTGILPVRWSAWRGLFQKLTGMMPVPLTPRHASDALNCHISILKNDNMSVTLTTLCASMFRWLKN
jgi:hypothetical protein